MWWFINVWPPCIIKIHCHLHVVISWLHIIPNLNRKSTQLSPPRHMDIELNHPSLCYALTQHPQHISPKNEQCMLLMNWTVGHELIKRLKCKSHFYVKNESCENGLLYLNCYEVQYNFINRVNTEKVYRIREAGYLNLIIFCIILFDC